MAEVKSFTADYLEKVIEPCDWQALWCTEVFDVLVEVGVLRRPNVEELTT